MPAIVLLLAESGEEGASTRRRILWISAILMLSFAYASTLFPYVLKPVLLANNFPALLVLLLAATVLALLWRPALSEPSK